MVANWMLENESSRSLCDVTFITRSGTTSLQTVSSSWDFSCVYFLSSLLGHQLAALGCEQFWCGSLSQGCVRRPTPQPPANPNAWLGSQSGNCWGWRHHTSQIQPPTNSAPAHITAWRAWGYNSPLPPAKCHTEFPVASSPWRTRFVALGHMQILVSSSRQVATSGILYNIFVQHWLLWYPS